jgi:hypothetical protein
VGFEAGVGGQVAIAGDTAAIGRAKDMAAAPAEKPAFAREPNGETLESRRVFNPQMITLAFGAEHLRE